MNFVIKDNSVEYRLAEECDCCQQLVWSSETFRQMKCELNSVKSRLNEIRLNEWSTHTSLTDKSSLIVDCLKRQLSRKPFLLTKAWIKMYEMLSDLQPIESIITDTISAGSHGSALNVLLLCECPGSFVNAINHYIKSHSFDVRLEWMANTLNPYYEDIDYTIIDDQFIKNSDCFRNWFFGSTNTGNILDKNFIPDLKHEMRDRNIEKFHFITCDGSISCVDCPDAQEEVVQPLVAKEILISLEVLAEKGCLVVKCFTLFECNTICLLYLLCCAFNQIHVFKPNASKSGNSEIYLICIGFQSTKPLNSILSKILTNYESSSEPKAIFSRQSVPQIFLTKLEECLKYFMDNQISVIKNNLQLFKSIPQQIKQQIINKNKNFAKKFIKNYNIYSISPFEEIVINSDNNCLNNCLQFKRVSDLLRNNDSYSHRKEENFFSINWFQRLNNVLIETSDKSCFKNHLIELKYWKQCWKQAIESNFKPVYGLPYNRIQNSKFSDLSLIISYNKCLKYKECFERIGKSFVSFSSDTKVILEKLISDLEINNEFFSKIIISSDNRSDDYVKQLCHLSRYESLDIIDDINNISKSESNVRHIYEINAFKAFGLELIEEKTVFIELIPKFCRINRLIGENDLLIIQIGFSLTRLMSATLYLISKSFKYYSIVPCIGSDVRNRHGLMCLFHSRDNEQKHKIEEIEQNFYYILNSFKNSEKDRSLVELISVPLLISDFTFYETLYNANSIQMLEILKIMSNIITN